MIGPSDTLRFSSAGTDPDGSVSATALCSSPGWVQPETAPAYASPKAVVPRSWFCRVPAYIVALTWVPTGALTVTVSPIR